jgi:hypothetical protein
VLGTVPAGFGIPGVPYPGPARLPKGSPLSAVKTKREGDQLAKAVLHVRIAVAMRPTDSNVLYNAACTYGSLAMKADALEMFQRCIKSGYSNSAWAMNDPDLKILHDDPEFRNLIGTKRSTPT